VPPHPAKVEVLTNSPTSPARLSGSPCFQDLSVLLADPCYFLTKRSVYETVLQNSLTKMEIWAKFRAFSLQSFD
jgi:hypothetical protein